MARLRVSTLVRAPRAEVWEALRDIGSHVHWMKDARTIRFRSGQTTGVGTSFECDTKVGPFKLLDLMEVTEWRERRAMGVRHTGVVRGTGVFRLKRRPGGTLFTWEERLFFPWWLGGRAGATVAKVVLRRIWAGNLKRFKALVEGRG